LYTVSILEVFFNINQYIQTRNANKLSVNTTTSQVYLEYLFILLSVSTVGQKIEDSPNILTLSVSISQVCFI